MPIDGATLAAICMLHAQQPKAYPLPSPAFNCATGGGPRAAPQPFGQTTLHAIASTPQARDAMARVVVAEAAGQGDSGMAGVVFTILNRLSDGRWGGTVEAVVDAPGQFEPVMQAGGSWRALRPVSAAQAARVSTIVNLALEGRLPDLTGGARYFQNPQIVAARARAGTVPASLVNFGGSTPSAVIGAHAFYGERAHVVRAPAGDLRAHALVGSRGTASAIFVGENGSDPSAEGRRTDVSRPGSQATDDGGAIFVQ